MCCEQDRLGVGARCRRTPRAPATGSRRSRRRGSRRVASAAYISVKKAHVQHPGLRERRTGTRRRRAKNTPPAGQAERGTRPHSAPRSRRAEQPLRPDQQDDDQDHEERDRRPGRRDRRPRPPTRATPITSAAITAPAEAAEAAEHDDRQQPRDQVVVAARVERVDHPEHRAGGSRGRGAEPEAERGHPLGVDAEQARRRSGSARSPGSRARTACAAAAGTAGRGSRPTARTRAAARPRSW